MKSCRDWFSNNAIMIRSQQARWTRIWPELSAVQNPNCRPASTLRWVNCFPYIPPWFSRFHFCSCALLPTSGLNCGFWLALIQKLLQSENKTMYRSIGHASTVDESLFGKGSGRMSKGRKTVTGPLGPSAVVISADELNRIKVPYWVFTLLVSINLFNRWFILISERICDQNWCRNSGW